MLKLHSFDLLLFVVWRLGFHTGSARVRAAVAVDKNSYAVSPSACLSGSSGSASCSSLSIGTSSGTGGVGSYRSQQLRVEQSSCSSVDNNVVNIRKTVFPSLGLFEGRFRSELSLRQQLYNSSYDKSTANRTNGVWTWTSAKCCIWQRHSVSHYVDLDHGTGIDLSSVVPAHCLDLIPTDTPVVSRRFARAATGNYTKSRCVDWSRVTCL